MVTVERFVTPELLDEKIDLYRKFSTCGKLDSIAINKTMKGVEKWLYFWQMYLNTNLFKNGDEETAHHVRRLRTEDPNNPAPIADVKLEGVLGEFRPPEEQYSTYH